MMSDQVKTLIHAQPFKPFTLHLADGQKFSVKHPELIWQTPGGRIVVVSRNDDIVELIDLLLVTTISIGNNAGDGPPRSKRKRA